MKEVYSTITKYKFGAKFRILILISMQVLIFFHFFVLIAPFIDFEKVQIEISEENIQHLITISNSISNITVAVILMFIIIEGQRSLRAMIIRQRKENYAQVEREIVDWFKETKPKSFDFDANLVTSEPTKTQEILRNFKVEGSPKKIMELYGYKNEVTKFIEEYCKKVHFELTCYPIEIIYGIHIEFDNYELSKSIYEKLESNLLLSRQSKDFKIDDIIPKKPGWVFITKTIELEGDEDKDFPKVLTHTRHFVELVGHCYDFLYEKNLVDILLNYHLKKSNNALAADS